MKSRFTWLRNKRALLIVPNFVEYEKLLFEIAVESYGQTTQRFYDTNGCNSR